MLLAAAAADTAGAGRPNVLLIVADDLGYSDLGCFGGEIATPNLDAYAHDGVRFTRMYSSARCCPSRASLLTGRYPHAVDLGHMTTDLGRPGYRGRLRPGTPTIADALSAAGYQTCLSGKWHLGTEDPTAHGFGRFFGTLVSCKDYWSPDRFYEIPAGHAQAGGGGEFFATDAVTDHALAFLADARRHHGHPWFLCVAYHAPHFPVHAPVEDIAEYRGRYDAGWDAVREARLKRQKALGLFPESLYLPDRSRFVDWAAEESRPVPAWGSLPADRRRDLARRMETYAAMVTRMDRQAGRVLDDLERHSEIDETLIVFVSDNGACGEWDPFGFDGVSGPGNVLHTGDALDEIGRPGSFSSVGAGWAMASNTPLRKYKHFAHEGGVRVPCFVHWPGAVRGAHERPRTHAFERTPTHLFDLTATILTAAGAAGPVAEDWPGYGLQSFLRQRNPRNANVGFRLPAVQARGDGVELGDDFDARPLFIEHEGHRAVVRGRHKLVAERGGPWRLYDVDRDPTESRPLQTITVKQWATPDRGGRGGVISRPVPEPFLREQRVPAAALVAELAALWDDWAAAHDVTPLPEDYGVPYLAGSRDNGRERMRDNE